MADSPHETALRLPLTATAASAHAGSPEVEVIALFDRLRDPLLRYLLSLGVSLHDGEEIVQETFLALFHHLRRGRSRENLPAWLFRVAHNLGMKRVRKGNTSPLAIAEQLTLADSSPSPEDQAADQQRSKHLMGAFRALPEQDRRCLALRAEGLRYREIAAVLDMSLGAVSASIARSLARLSRAAVR